MELEVEEERRGRTHTVSFVCFAEDIPLKVLLLLHGGVQLSVIVLQKQKSFM